MNLNATIIGQMIAFALFVAFCMKYVWPPIMAALEDRKKKIADGLAAAERGRHEQELAEKRAQQVIHEEKSRRMKLFRKHSAVEMKLLTNQKIMHVLKVIAF